MKQVAIVGSGLIGQAWAIVFARAGYHARMWDFNPQILPDALKSVAQQIRTLEQHQLVDDAESVISRIGTFDVLDEAVKDVIYVQESIPEQVPLKQDIFARLDAATDADTILASSTSSIPASQFTASLKGRQRCLVAHPVNPPYLIPVVELCAAPWTDEDTMARARQIMLDVGQKPVVVYGEPQGFVLNRLQGALLREAFRLVQAGHVSVEDLDVTVKDGLGLRWSFMGPFETIDLNAPAGISDYCERYGGMYRDIATQQVSTEAWSPALVADVQAQRRERLSQDKIDERRLWRDDALMSLLVHKRAHNM